MLQSISLVSPEAISSVAMPSPEALLSVTVDSMPTVKGLSAMTVACCRQALPVNSCAAITRPPLLRRPKSGGCASSQSLFDSWSSSHQLSTRVQATPASVAQPLFTQPLRKDLLAAAHAQYLCFRRLHVAILYTVAWSSCRTS